MNVGFWRQQASKLRARLITVTLAAAIAGGFGCASLEPFPAARLLPEPVETDVNSLPGYLSATSINSLAGDRMSVDGLRKLLSAEQQITHQPLVDGNEVKLLLDGPATFDAIYAAMGKAEREILVEFFILAEDEVGQTFARHLIEAGARGVNVKVIYDAVGSLGTSDSYLDRLTEAGIQIHPLNPLLEELDDINNRNHRKLVIVDNTTVILGGVNVTRAYALSSTTDPGEKAGMMDAWRDTSIKIRGPAVDYYRKLFERDWTIELGQAPLPEARPQHAVGNVLIRPLYSNGGDDHEFAIYQTYLNAIRHAERKIWLTHAYFSPDEAFLEVLEAAARRGVDVRLILPGFIDFDIIYHASRANYSRLLRAGVRIYERQDALLHSKTAVIDGLWATVGSANLDIRSFIHNDEVNAVVVDQGFGDAMETIFKDDLGQAREITLDDWRDRGVLARVKEFLARRLNYFL